MAVDAQGHLTAHPRDGTPGPDHAEATRDFSNATRSPSDARHFVREVLAEWGIDELIDSCALVVSELATNAICHARSDFSVSLKRVADGVEVAVRDASAALPVMVQPDPLAANGRGLQLVATVAHRWGYREARPGKLVWAQIASRPADEKAQ